MRVLVGVLQPAIEVIGVMEGLVEQRADVVIGGRVIHEGALTAWFDQAGQTELGQMLADGWGIGADQLGQAVDRRFALQEGPEDLDAIGVGE